MAYTVIPVGRPDAWVEGRAVDGVRHTPGTPRDGSSNGGGSDDRESSGEGGLSSEDADPCRHSCTEKLRSVCGGKGRVKPLDEVLAEDIYAHIIMLVLTQRPSRGDKIRGLVLLLFVILAQIFLSVALFNHSLVFIRGYELDLESARRNAGTSTYVDEGEALKHVCGIFLYQYEPVEHGVLYRMSKGWEMNGAAKSQIERFRDMLSADYQLVFFALIMLWTWTCLNELRATWHALRAFWEYDQLVVQRMDVLHQNTSGEDSSTENLEDNLTIGVTYKGRVSASLLLALRFFVTSLFWINGYLLLCITEQIIELILNAVALEFIFNVDDVIVHAILARRERNLLTAMKYLERKDFPKLATNTAKRSDWRSRAWLRILLMVVVVGGFLFSYDVKIRSLHTRTQVLCLTNGLTDGTVPIPADSPTVVFPVRGFCSTFVDAFAGFEEPSTCWATRLGADGPLTGGYCKYLGNLRTAHWERMSDSDRNVRRMCTEFWFGEGLENYREGARVPALLAPGADENNPQMFGCRTQDLELVTRKHWWPFFTSGPAYFVYLYCHRPAYGPRSLVWDATPLTSHLFLPPRYFYRNDPRSPLEHQMQSCNDLPGVHSCGGQDCFTLAGDLADVRASHLVCEAAAKRGNRTCAALEGRPCDVRQAISLEHSEAVCYCRLPEEQRVCGNLPHALARCEGDPCKVLVASEDAVTGAANAYANCHTYCSAAGLRCVSQWRVRRRTCVRVRGDSATLACADALQLQGGTLPTRVCECRR